MATHTARETHTHNRDTHTILEASLHHFVQFFSAVCWLSRNLSPSFSTASSLSLTAAFSPFILFLLCPSLSFSSVSLLPFPPDSLLATCVERFQILLCGKRLINGIFKLLNCLFRMAPRTHSHPHTHTHIHLHTHIHTHTRLHWLSASLTIRSISASVLLVAWSSQQGGERECERV